MKTSSRAMLMAHHLYTSDRKIIAPITHIEVRSWSQCLRMAWYFIRLRKALSHGFATFSFYKKDGSIREARATLFLPLIPADKWPKEKEPSAISYQPSVFTFFDLDKQEWRSFSIANFIGFVTLYEVKESKEKEPKRK